jgi:Flagellar biosynthesis protein, FliO
MRSINAVGQQRLSGPTATSFEASGLVECVLSLLRGWRGEHAVQQKQLRLVETLALGGKRELMLVTCGEESFLIGGGPESVESIVRVGADVSLHGAAKNPAVSCA